MRSKGALHFASRVPAASGGTLRRALSVALGAAAALAAPTLAEAAARPAPPNVVVVLADDLGYNAVSIHGNPYITTPNIDAIARGGARFITGYAGDAICSPSRAALLTGRNPQRFGFEFLPYTPGFAEVSDGTFAKPRHPAMALPDRPPPTPGTTAAGDRTHPRDVAEDSRIQNRDRGQMASRLRAGTASLRHGFDEFYGIIGGAGLFADRNDPSIVHSRQPWSGNDGRLWARANFSLSRNDGPPQPAKGYMTDLLTQEAVDYIDRNAGRPFFLYLAYTAPHMPLQAPKRIYDQLGVVKDERLRTYYAMIKSMDEGVGRVMAELRRKGLDKNTLVVFTSDNGGTPFTRNPVQNLPFRGSKITYFEGGLNVPFFMSWPDRIPAGTVVRGPASALDIVPTSVAAARVPLPSDRAYDGLDLLPRLSSGDAGALDQRPPLVWRKDDYYAVRDGRHVLQVSQHPEKTWLFDLDRDPAQRVNLAESRPDVVARLKAIFEERAAAFIQPRWGAARRARVDIDSADDLAADDAEHIYWAN